MSLKYTIYLKKLKRVIPFLFFILSLSLFSQNTVLISVDGVDNLEVYEMPFTHSLMDNGIHASSIKPVFPTQTLPNIVSVLSGKLPSEHGISANFFKNVYSDEYFGYSDRNCEFKWYQADLIWKALNLRGINTVSVEYPMQYSCDYNINAPIDYVKKDSNYLKILDGIVQKNERNFVAIHFKEADLAAHTFGKNSNEYKNTLLELDDEIREIINIFDKDDNFIVHSTFNAVDFDSSKYIEINDIEIPDSLTIINQGTMLLIYDRKKSFNINDSLLNSKLFTIYGNMPKSIDPFTQLNYPYLTLIAKFGYVFTKDPESLSKLKSVHGYDPNYIDMQGFLRAKGDKFKSNFSTSTIEIQYIYDLILSTYGLKTKNYLKIERFLNSQSILQQREN